MESKISRMCKSISFVQELENVPHEFLLVTAYVLRLVSTTIEHFVAMENIDARVDRRDIQTVPSQLLFRSLPFSSRIRSFWFSSTPNQNL